MVYYRAVADKKTTWKKLIAAGLVLEKYSLPHQRVAPSRVAMEKLKK